MAENPEVVEGLRIVRSRKRIESIKIERETIAERIKQFYDKDMQDRTADIDARLQRYAKFRMWTEGRDWQWQNASDAAIPDMMTASMRMQDTLHNAVMSQRPPIMAKATRKPDKEKEEKINHLIDFQIFEEQPGEDMIGQLADDFVNEGFFTAYVPWVTERRMVHEIKVYDPIPPESLPVDHFLGLLEGMFPKAELTPTKDGWDWEVLIDKDTDKAQKRKASFFSRDDGRIEMEIGYETLVYDGPRVIRKDLQDVLHPARCENLQIPSPSNPMGASHVILRDFPTIDEIQRLYQEGYYDLMSGEDAEKLGVLRMDTSYQQREEQKDTMQGHTEQSDKPKGAESHKPLTRLMCFDCFDINGDGLDEDVVFWMILEDKIILRAKYLTQMFPSNPPRRPFAEAQLFPVPGRRYGISLLEMMEGLHDLMKMFFDQGADSGILANSPFFFYRSSSNMRPEVIRLWPGEGYPLADPQADVNFPNMGNKDQSFMFNMVALLTQVEERLTNIGDLQLGRVPQGKASALRTVSGMQTVLAQGDARPERVLRRFFMGLTQIWEQVHRLNEVFLPKKKQFMLSGENDPRKDPYLEIGQSEVKGKFRFTFSANTLNTSKEAMRAAIEAMMGTYVSELAIALRIVTPDGVYRLFRDYGKAWGQDPDKYLSPPTPGAMEPPINAEEAILLIIDGVMPKGSPMEGLQEHFQKLVDFSQSDEFGYVQPQHVPLFRAYMEHVAQAMSQEQAQQKMMLATSNFQKGAQPPGQPGPQAAPQPNPQQMPMLQGGELADESLPSAGGGANAGMMA